MMWSEKKKNIFFLALKTMLGLLCLAIILLVVGVAISPILARLADWLELTAAWIGSVISWIVIAAILIGGTILADSD
jgi:uncharacterized membrane protein YGL010W